MADEEAAGAPGAHNAGDHKEAPSESAKLQRLTSNTVRWVRAARAARGAGALVSAISTTAEATRTELPDWFANARQVQECLFTFCGDSEYLGAMIWEAVHVSAGEPLFRCTEGHVDKLVRTTPKIVLEQLYSFGITNRDPEFSPYLEELTGLWKVFKEKFVGFQWFHGGCYLKPKAGSFFIADRGVRPDDWFARGKGGLDEPVPRDASWHECDLALAVGSGGRYFWSGKMRA